MSIEQPMSRGRRVLHRIGCTLIAIVSVLVLLTVAFLVYANMVMPGERPAAIDVWTNPAIHVVSTEHSIIMTPTSPGTDAGTGLVFIPGAKVDPYGYMYKLSGIVESSGVTVVITKPTLNLAFFDVRPISTFTDDAPQVTRWYVGGHSLGGVRACQLADPAVTSDPKIVGLILFGSYCANDLSHTSLKALSISGSDDGLSTPKKIDAAAVLLPGSASFVQITGANHASFGNYGVQPGDGKASISSSQVRTEVTQALTKFLG